MDRLQGVVQRFRSGSVEREKEPLFLGVPESRSRSYSTNEADKLKKPSPLPSRKADMEEQKSALLKTAADQPSRNSAENTAPPSDKNHYRKKPSGTFEYTVQEGDTLVKIGARFDVIPSEMMKINKLLSRTVFVGQTLFIPDSKNTESDSSTPRSGSPLPNTTGDANGISLPSVSNRTLPITPPPGHVTVTTDEVSDSKPHELNNEVQKTGREHQQKFIRMPVRRLLEEEETDAPSGGTMVKGTLLVTTNVIMFDSDVSDPHVVSSVDPQKFNTVVYMEEIKSVALFHDLTPRMFWKQSKEIRAQSPKPETYHSGQKNKTLKEESLLEEDSENVDPDGPAADSLNCDRSNSHQRASPNGGDHEEAASNRTSDKSGHVEELSEKTPDSSAQHRLSAELGHSSHANNSDKSSSDTHHPEPTPAGAGTNVTLTDHNLPAESFEPLHFTDKSPSRITSHPQAVHGQPVSPSQSSAGGNEEAEIANANLSISNSSEQLKVTEKTSFSTVKTDLDDSNNSGSLEKSPVVRSRSATLDADSEVTSQENESKRDKSPLRITKSLSGRSSPWSSKAQSMVDKLAFQVSNLSWDTAGNQKEGSPKSRESSPHSYFRAPAPISRLFNYTSNLFQGQAAADKDLLPSTADNNEKPLPPHRLQLKSHFTKEDMSRALGPDPRGFLLRSDSRHFVEPPLYLQIRRGVRKDAQILQPRAFDHWNTGPILNEYWFVVPRVMGDKLYNFLMTWQPDAYGDEEETQPRGQFFYDVDDVNSLRTPFIKVTGTAGDESGGDLNLSDDHFKEAEKSWEILSKEEVYGTQKTIYRQDTIDDNPPELIGPTVIITPEYLRAILRSLPPSMTVGYNWELVYGTHKHGYSLQNMYMKTEKLGEDEPVLLFIMDTHGVAFGAYLSNTIRQNETFYGTGATFLFSFLSGFKKFSWARSNNFFIHGTKDFFAVGAGEGVYGLWVDSDLNKGCSQQCPTFMNDVLATEEDFSILQLEVWKFVDNEEIMGQPVCYAVGTATND